VRAGERVVRVPTQMMAGVRRSARQPGKSDAIDALAVARAAWREPDLPAARLDGPSRQVRLLVDHRDDLVGERTRIQSRIRWHLHEIAPDLEIPARGLKLQHVIDRVADRLASIDGLIAAIARELLDRLRELNRRINELEREIKPMIAALAPALLTIPGCGALHGNTKAEALRLLRRRLSDVVYRTMLIDEPVAQPVQAINTHTT
jgi:transposase